MVGEIVHLQARLDAVDRPVLREPLARTLRTEIENFQHRVSGFHEPLASEFRAAAAKWLEIADRQLREAQAVVDREPTPQVFRAGDPVDREREAFVSRDRVVGKLEQQVLLATGCPGIVLYGRRRMGKSTVLRNLEGFLPPSVRIATISMQQAEAFASLESLIARLGRGRPGPARNPLGRDHTPTTCRTCRACSRPATTLSGTTVDAWSSPSTSTRTSTARSARGSFPKTCWR